MVNIIRQWSYKCHHQSYVYDLWQVIVCSGHCQIKYLAAVYAILIFDDKLWIILIATMSIFVYSLKMTSLSMIMFPEWGQFYGSRISTVHARYISMTWFSMGRMTTTSYATRAKFSKYDGRRSDSQREKTGNRHGQGTLRWAWGRLTTTEYVASKNKLHYSVHSTSDTRRTVLFPRDGKLL